MKLDDGVWVRSSEIVKVAVGQGSVRVELRGRGYVEVESASPQEDFERIVRAMESEEAA